MVQSYPFPLCSLSLHHPPSFRRISQNDTTGKIFGEEWTKVLRKVQQAAGAIQCTSHHLEPVVIEALKLQANFNLNPQFKMERSCRHGDLKSKIY